MTLLAARVAYTRWLPQYAPRSRVSVLRMHHSPKSYHTSLSLSQPQNNTKNEQKHGEKNHNPDSDPRINNLGRAIEDDFATIRENYVTPKNPIVLAHGLMGFDQLRLAGSLLPGLQYWRGITEAMAGNGIEVIIASVPPTGSIEERAAALGKNIAAKANGKSVNIIAHSMGGLDARYMISKLQPDNVNVLSLTTIATPHRGSSFADYLFEEIPEKLVPRIYNFLASVGISSGAYKELTTSYMRDTFNPNTRDVQGVQYFSYGATFDPDLWSAFRMPHRIVQQREGPNDGLVSVESARWGTYKGTLVNVSHLDLINWTNRMKWYFWRLGGYEKKFNAIAFYLDIADMLAKEGL